MTSELPVCMVSLLFLHHRLILVRALFNLLIATSTLSPTTDKVVSSAYCHQVNRVTRQQGNRVKW